LIFTDVLHRIDLCTQKLGGDLLLCGVHKVYKGIYGMHHTQNYKVFMDVRCQVLTNWKVQLGAVDFTDYFQVSGPKAGTRGGKSSTHLVAMQ
jgi:hypothetical protein